MSRLRSNNVFGTITDSPLTNVATTVNSAGLANLAAVASPDYAVITLDPDRVNGAPEIIYITAHTGSATSATILRGREGTSAREHPAGTFWVHAPTGRDLALGELAYAPVTSNQGSITTLVDLTSLTVTFTPQADRRVRISADLMAQSNNAGSRIDLVLADGSNNILQLRSIRVPASGVNMSFHLGYVETVTGAALTRKLRMQDGAAAGTITMAASSTSPAFLLVEDIGPVRTAQPS